YSKATPLNEGAILYSYTQDVKEKRNCLGTPHWEKVWALYSAGLMCGLPMSIVYEEDILKEILFDEEDNLKFKMIFLIGIKDLPEEVKKQIDRFIDKGGIVFSDEESLKFEKGVNLNLENFYDKELKSAMWIGYAADSWFPILQPILEKLALKIKQECNKYRSFPVDTDNLWVSKNIFDGGEIKYIHLASEMAPFSWKPEDAWYLQCLYRKGYLPITTTLSFPYIKNAKIYDVYQNSLVTPSIKDKICNIKVDLINYSGKLYAIVPDEVGFPEVKISEKNNNLIMRISVSNKKFGYIKGIIPLEIQIFDRNDTFIEKIYRSTEKNGILTLSFPLYLNESKLNFKITELLTGNSKDIEVDFSTSIKGDCFIFEPEVKIFREESIKNILKEVYKNKKSEIVIHCPSKKYLEKATEIKEILEEEGKKVILETGIKIPSQYDFFISIGDLEEGKVLNEIIAKGIQFGVFDISITKNILGPGRCLITSIFSIPNAYKKGIVIIGNDERGTINGLNVFEEFLIKNEFPKTKYEILINSTLKSYTIKREYVRKIETLGEKIGIKIKDLKLSETGKYILIGANTFCKNLALIEDNGNSANVIKTERVGQAEEIYNLYIDEKNRKIGATSRDIDNGSTFYLYDFEKEKPFIFLPFGDNFGCSFGVGGNGDIVIVGGKYGVICYKYENNQWRKKWSIDYWKEFEKLDWPVSNNDERNPLFNVKIPEGKDYAIILFSETTNNGWVTPDHSYSAEIFAVKIETGEIIWKYQWRDELYFPSLILGDNGQIILVNLQIGSWGKERRKIYIFNYKGENIGKWDIPSGFTPIDIKINEKEGLVGIIYAPRRIVEIRDFSGKNLLSLLWKNQPISLDFIENNIVLSDEGGKISKIDYQGNLVIEENLNYNIKKVLSYKDKIYAIGYNGFLIKFDNNFKKIWEIDVDNFLKIENPMNFVKNLELKKENLITYKYPSITKNYVPEGEDKIKLGLGDIKIGGTKGWMSEGKVEIKSDQLKNRKIDDVNTPWLNLDELFWNALSGRQIWIEIEFYKPEDINYLTIYENPNFPNSWVKEAVVQVWDEDNKKWETVKFGIFLNNFINTYELHLKSVKKVRFVPLSNYFKNFYISEVEVR
ncbi:MAG: discoidin domain-containing protein, partial [Candidatus Omnitrophica bacterium]|nr:discoidin domain-containing protein [Candidatus Omnitrophota bacterium]